MRSASLLIFVGILAACATNDAAQSLPTNMGRAVGASSPTTIVATIGTLALVVPSATSAPPTATLRATASDQYRAWMVEARNRYPYSESVEQMWEVMICESSGNPDLVAGSYNGLFQYSQATWEGDWNPYRDRPVLDPQAQIFATAKAWHDGYQSWWGCYRG